MSRDGKPSKNRTVKKGGTGVMCGMIHKGEADSDEECTDSSHNQQNEFEQPETLTGGWEACDCVD